MCAAFGIFPFPWLHFICLYSLHIMSHPSNLHWFLPCVLHLSNVPLSKLHLLFLCFIHLQFLPLFNLHFAFPFFLQLSCVPLSDLHFPIPFFALFLRFFQDVNILEQAQFDSTNVQTPCKLQQLPPDLLFDTFRHIPSCAFVAFAQHRRCRGRCGATGFGSSWNWLTGIQVLLQSKDGERPKKKENINFSTIKLAIPNFRETYEAPF